MFILTKRCISLTLLIAAVAALISPAAFAIDDEHGASISAACSGLVYTCDSDADCDGQDGDLCGDDFCIGENDYPPGVRPNLRCTFTAGNDDDFDDNLEIRTTSIVRLVIKATDGDVTVDYPTARINGVAGTVTCADDGGQPILPCTLGSDAGGQDPGEVQFIVDTYLPKFNDPNPIPTQATIQYFDKCDSITKPDPGGCVTDVPNTLQASPSQPTATGCDSRPKDCDDGNACTADSCNSTTGECVNTPKVCDDGNACTPDSCNTTTGECEVGPPKVCDDGNACTPDSCNTTTGECEVGPPKDCDDLDECTDDYCDSLTGECVNEDNGTCGIEICRTPGFWGARGGDEKGQNITQAVIGDGLEVCGLDITNTDLGNNESAIEAICINKGDPKAKLIRHLTAAALNCELGTCSADTSGALAECNSVCEAGTDIAAMNACGSVIDCFNNGGHVMYDDDAQEYLCLEAGYGLCDESGGVCMSNGDCDLDNYPNEVCEMFDNCHDDTSLCEPDSDFCFEPPGPASSPKKCNEARKDTDYIFNLPPPTTP